jgi:hypothetical protein
LAKVTGPLLSVDASGKIADTIVFSRWRGKKYVRQWVVPANPNTAAQQTQRAYMTTAINSWVQSIGASAQQAWRDYQAGQELSGANEYVSRHIKAALAALTIRYCNTPVATPGVGQVTITWNSNTSCTGRVLKGTSHRVYYGQNDEGAPATSHSVVVTGLAAGVKYFFFITSTSPGTEWSECGEVSATPT